MRIWGRVTNPDGTRTWVAVVTTPEGDDTAVRITQLIQVLKLNLNESPFYADWGIPAYPAVAQQIPPDYYVQLTQQRFAQYFASLTIARISANPPTYNINLLTKQGSSFSQVIAA
jgi:hypothetical protein